jgi:hypothetical protein
MKRWSEMGWKEKLWRVARSIFFGVVAFFILAYFASMFVACHLLPI